MFIKFNSSCQLTDDKCVILVNGIEYMIYWLLVYFEFNIFDINVLMKWSYVKQVVIFM